MWRKAWIYERPSKRGMRYAVRHYDDGGRMRTESAGERRICAVAGTMAGTWWPREKGVS